MDDKADWRNYRFPREIEGTLNYDYFNKKIRFTSAETFICENGCYILISIKTSVIKSIRLYNEFQFLTLLADFSPKMYLEKEREQNQY